MIRSNVASSTSASGSRSSSMAAPFTAQCSPPKASTVPATSASTDEASATSAAMKRPLPPAVGDQLDGLLAAVGGDVRHDDLGAGLGEGDGDRPAHPAGAARSRVRPCRRSRLQPSGAPFRVTRALTAEFRAGEEDSVLIGLDEHPLHQITQSFAGVAGSDSQWNDGHYVCLCDVDGNVCLTSNVRLYQNNDVLDGFVCIRHDGRQHNIRLSRRLRPDMDHYGVGPLRIEIVEPMRTLRFVLEDNEFGIACDVLCHEHRAAVRGSGRDHPHRRPAAERAGHLRARRCLRRVGRGGGAALRADAGDLVVLPQPLVGQPGRAWRPALRGAATAAAGARRAAVGAVPRATATAASTSSTRAAGRPPARGRSCSPTAPSPVTDVEHDLRVLRRRPAGAAWHVPADRRRRHRARRTRSPTSAGCTARVAGTSAGSTTASARASTAATFTSRARSGT